MKKIKKKHKEEGKADKKERRTGPKPEANADHRGDSKIESALLFSLLDNKRKNAKEAYARGVWPVHCTSAKLKVAQKPVPAAPDEGSPHYSAVYSELGMSIHESQHFIFPYSQSFYDTYRK
jgi:hypothetical protein